MTVPATEGEAQPTAEELWKSVAAENKSPSDETPRDPPKVEVPAVPTETVAPVTQAHVDPYAGLSPAVVDKLKQLDTLTVSLRQAHGNIGNLMQQNKDLLAQAAAAKAAPATPANPAASQTAAAKATSEKFEQLKKEFPELADALEERLGLATAAPDLDALRSQIQKDLEGDITTKLTAKVREEIAAETEARLLNAAHRNWTETVRSPEFVEWQKVQPEEIKALGASARAEDAMQMLDLYKAQLPAPAPTVDPAKILADRQARLAAAATHVHGNAGMAPVKSVDDMTPAEIWAHEAKMRRDAIAAQQR